MATTSAYSASKHALNGLVKCIALEVAKYNISINAICPGRTNTKMTQRTAKRLSALSNTPMTTVIKNFNTENAQRKMIEPEEIANLALFLIKQETTSITGECYGITGGISYYQT